MLFYANLPQTPLIRAQKQYARFDFALKLNNETEIKTFLIRTVLNAISQLQKELHAEQRG